MPGDTKRFRFGGFDRASIEAVTVENVTKAPWNTGAYDISGEEIVVNRYFIDIGPLSIELTDYDRKDWEALIDKAKTFLLT